MGIDTGRLPSGTVQWSPRLGVNYDLRADGNVFLRGGIGLFSGPPPYTFQSRFSGFELCNARAAATAAITNKDFNSVSK